MASVNFQKFKSAGDAKAQFRHSDKEERLRHQHANKQIDKSKSHINLQYKRDYAKTCEFYDKRIAELDKNGNSNRRKDRVTLMGIEVPVPEHLDVSDYGKWFSSVNHILQKRYGEKNIVNAYIHFDEQHDYLDSETGQMRTSRVHAHFYVIPEVDGSLNAKTLMTRKNFISLDNEIEKMSVMEFGCRFMTGSKKKSGKTVEQLKAESRVAEAEKRAAALERMTDRQQTDLGRRQRELDRRESELDEREALLERREIALKRSESDFQRKSEELAVEQQKAVTAQNKAKETISDCIRQVEGFRAEVNQKVHAVQRSGRKVPSDLESLQKRLDEFQF